MASGSVKLTSAQSWAGRIDWTSSQVPGKNASSVEAKCYVWRTDGGESFGNNPYCGSLTVGSVQSSLTFNRINGKVQFVGGCWAQVAHDSSGIGIVTIGARISGSDHNDLTGSTLEGSEEVTLDPIQLAKPSRISFSSNPIQMGKQLLISIDRDQKDCRHELSWRFGSQSGIIARNAQSSAQWTVPDLAAECGLSGDCTVTCKTYRGETYLGLTSGTLTLLVPDPTVPALSLATLGTRETLACPRNSGNFTLELSLLLQDREYALGSGAVDSLAWTPEYALAAVMPDQVQMTGTIRCRTYNRSQLVGTMTCPIRLTVPDNEHTRPRLTALELTPLSDRPEFGFLRGKSGLTAKMEAQAPLSRIGEYGLTLGTEEVSGNPAVIPVLEQFGTLRVTGWVTDLRGFRGTLSREITVIPYEKPRVIPASGREAVICQRAAPSGALSPGGTRLAIRAGKQSTGIRQGTENINPCILRYRWRQGGQTDFTPWVTLLEEQETQAEVLLEGIVTSLEHSYQVELSAVDRVGEEDRQVFQIMTRAVSFGLYDGVDGAAFGKYPESPHVVDLAPQMTLLVRGKLELRGEQWTDLGLGQGISSPVTAHGQVEGCAIRLSGGNHVYVACSCRLPGENQTVNREPIPEALRPAAEVAGLCAGDGAVAALSVGTDGFLRLRLLSGRPDPRWIDGALDYFL